MATTFCEGNRIVERRNSPQFESSGTSSKLTRTYDIHAGSESAALLLLKGQAPIQATVDLILLGATPKYSISAVDVVNGSGTYTGTVTYGHAARDEQTVPENELLSSEEPREKVSFSFSGASAHVTEARDQTKYGTLAPECGNATDVDLEGVVEGHDINARTGSFTVDTLIPAATASNEWFRDRFRQVWTVNDAPFRSWPVGDVALAGMDGRQRADGDWEISYSFQIQPSEDITNFAGIDTGGAASKEGWQYLWVMYRPSVTDSKLAPTPTGVYVATDYEYSDFSQLGILV